MHLLPWGDKTELPEVMAFNVKNFLDEHSTELWKTVKELAVNELPGITAVIETDD